MDMNFDSVTELYVQGREVSELYVDGKKAWEAAQGELSGLCFTAEQANSNIKLTKVGSPPEISVQYSTNGRTWSDYTFGDLVQMPNVGDCVWFRQNGTSGKFSSSNYNCYKFQSTSGRFSCDGRIQYLLNKDGTSGTNQGRVFAALFQGNAGLTRVTGPITLTSVTGSDAFNAAFADCPNLEEFSELCVTSNGSATFSGMFRNCRSLRKGPSVLLPSDAKGWGYNNMFNGCSSLTAMPEIMATTGGGGSQEGFNNMFEGCVSLSSVTPLHFSTIAGIREMFKGCTNISSIPLISASSFNNPTTNGFVDGTAVHSLSVDMCVASAVPSLTSSTLFSSMRTDGQAFDYRILVRPTLYDEWIQAANWQDISSHIQGYDSPTQTYVKYVDNSLSIFNLVGGGGSVQDKDNAAEIRFGTQVNSLGFRAFQNCSNLVSVDIPGTVKEIGLRCFAGCTSLSSATFHEGTGRLNMQPFNDSKITELVLPSTISSIGMAALGGMPDLTSVTFLGKTTAQVAGMWDYPWGVNASIIHGELG